MPSPKISKNTRTTGYRADEKRAAWLHGEAQRRGWSIQQLIDFGLDVFQRLTTCASLQPRVRR